MTNEIAVTGSLVALDSIECMPEDLARALRLHLYRIESGLLPGSDWHPDAQRYADAWRERLTPVTLQQVRDWCNDLVDVGLTSKGGASLEARAGGIFLACRGIPGICWTPDTVALALQTFRWFPVPAEVFDLLKPEAERLRAMVTALDALASAPPRIVAREPAVPYDPGPANLRPGRYDRPPRRALHIQPPVRTVEQQIAALKAAP